MKKKQTAVEWFVEQLDKLEYEYDVEGISILEFDKIKIEIENQAKKMEKEQILDAWTDGYSCGMYQEGLGIDYYNETYLGIIKEEE
jgi:hypothetical protein